MAHWPFYLLGICCLLAAGNLVVHLLYAYMALRRFENRPAFLVLPPPAGGPEPEAVRIPTSDNLLLSGGIYFPPDGHPHGVVVFCCETGGTYQTAMNYVPALVDAGFAVVSFDFRNQGNSESLPTYHATHWLTEHEVADVHAVLDFVTAQPQFTGLPIGLCGISRGAGAALAAGATRPEVQALWAQGAFATHSLVLHYSQKWIQCIVGPVAKFVPIWHVRVTIWFMLRMAEFRNGGRFVRLESLLPRWKDRPVLFTSGARDTYVPTPVSRGLLSLTGHSPDEALWSVPSAKHNMERLAAPEEYDVRIVDFFEQMAGRREQEVAAEIAIR